LVLFLFLIFFIRCFLVKQNKNTKQQKTKATIPTKIRVEPKCSGRVINTYVL
jgi:hypothetical protein